MAVPSPAEADAATVRVRLVADMLVQKAQEVQSKGNAGAAHSLSESAADLQRAAALLLELARLVHLPPARLRSDSDASFSSVVSNDGTSSMSSLSVSVSGPTSSRGGPPAASRSAKDLVAKLGRVDALLGKKSDEMRHKGNEGAANALHQSALAVRNAVQHIADQQLMTRTLVVTTRALREQLREHCRLLLVDNTIADETTLDDELTRRAMASLRELAAMRAVLRDVVPETTSADQLRDRLQRLVSPASPRKVEIHSHNEEDMERVVAETMRLQQQLTEAQAHHTRELRDAHDARENMRTQCEALEKALQELEAEYHERRERELEHLSALHERQKDTHEELKKLLLAKEEEVAALKLQAEAWMNQLTHQRDTVAELQAQREHDEQLHDRQAGDLRGHLHARDTELLALREELRGLRHQLEEPSGHDNLERIAEELRQQLKAMETQRDVLRLERDAAGIAAEKAQHQIDEMQSDFLAKTEEAARSAHAAMEERDARIAELEAALASVEERTNDGASVESAYRQQALQDEVDRLRQDLETEQTRRAELEQEYAHARAALATAQKELDARTQELSLLRDEEETRSGEEAERVKALESQLLEKDESLARVTASGDETKHAVSAVQAELATTSHQLQDAQQELAAVQEEFAVWKRELWVVVQDVCGEGDEGLPAEDASCDHVAAVLHRRYSQLLGKLKETKKRCDELVASHEAELTRAMKDAQAELSELQEQHEELRSTLHQVEHDKAMIETKYEALHATQLASSETNGVKANESDELRTKLLEVETEFERYRTRSHAALKKVEKRAELLNSMRKENESLTKAIADFQVARDAAVEKEQLVTAQLEEATRSLIAREEESKQHIENVRAKFEEAEQQCAALFAEKKELEQKHEEAVAKVAALQEEKEELARAKHAVHEQALQLKDTELEESKKRLEDTDATLARRTEQVGRLEDTIVERDEQIALLESERQARRDVAELRATELEQSRDEMAAKVEQISTALEETQRGLSAAVASRNAEKEETKSSAENESKRDAQETEELRAKLQAATHESEQLTTRLMEIQLAKVAAEQEAEQLRTLVASLQSEQANASSALPMSSPAIPSEELAALKESRHAQEAKVQHLLDEIEMMTKRQMEDQRIIADLNEQLTTSKQSCDEVQEQLRLAEDRRRTVQDSAERDALTLTIRTLRERVQVLEASGRNRKESDDDNHDDAIECADDLALVQASRLATREQHANDLEAANRKQLVNEYLQKTSDVVRELQQSMDEYSSVFRDACALRDEAVEGQEGGKLNGAGSDEAEAEPKENGADPLEYEEYLTLTSGVVVKAGATFSLPVYCDKPGGRVEWKFAVKEDGADVGFALVVETTTLSTGDGSAATRETIVAPARVHDLLGVFDASADATVTTTLRFEWDNSFSWLNEKTLDYHVSVLQPLSKTKQALRTRRRALQKDVATLDERLALLRVEKEKREQLETARHHFEQCGDDKDEHAAGFATRREAIQRARTELQTRMEELQAQLRGLVAELDDMTTGEREVASAWEALQSEHEDVDMTVKLSANSRLDELRQTLETKKSQLEEELAAVTHALAAE